MYCKALTIQQILPLFLCHHPEKERKESEEIVEEMKEKDREERGIGMEVRNRRNKKHSPSILTCYKNSRPCSTISQYQLDAPVMLDTQHLHHTQPPPNYFITS